MDCLSGLHPARVHRGCLARRWRLLPAQVMPREQIRDVRGALERAHRLLGTSTHIYYPPSSVCHCGRGGV
eukprot:9487141-Pyramimonas_sp.AAC.1